MTLGPDGQSYTLPARHRLEFLNSPLSSVPAAASGAWQANPSARDSIVRALGMGRPFGSMTRPVIVQAGFEPDSHRGWWVRNLDENDQVSLVVPHEQAGFPAIPGPVR